jgi:hypothetical protein
MAAAGCGVAVALLALSGCQSGDRQSNPADDRSAINNNSDSKSGAAPGPGAPESTSSGAKQNTGDTKGLTGQQVKSGGASPAATRP